MDESQETRVVKQLAALLRPSEPPAKVGDAYEFQVRLTEDSRLFRLSRPRLQAALAELETLKIDKRLILYNSTSYESRISREGSFPRLTSVPPLDIKKSDTSYGVTYALSRPSDSYFLFVLNELSKMGNFDRLRPSIELQSMKRKNFDTYSEVGLLDLAKVSLPQLRTVRVTTTSPQLLGKLSQLASSFLFQLTYNIDLPLVPKDYLEDFFRVSGMVKTRSTDIDEIEPPRRIYDPILVSHYQMGLASERPPFQYLSFYHVAEHLFPTMAYEEIVKGIRDKITSPSFSLRRDKDIESLASYVGKRIKHGDYATYKEDESLQRVLQKYVELPNLSASLDQFESSLLRHYKETQVSFSKGDRVDFSWPNIARIHKALAARIYKTRNAIVHSKEGNTDLYVPFENDHIVAKEVPLLRFIAEQIIIGSSKTLD